MRTVNPAFDTAHSTRTPMARAIAPAAATGHERRGCTKDDSFSAIRPPVRRVRGACGSGITSCHGQARDRAGDADGPGGPADVLGVSAARAAPVVAGAAVAAGAPRRVALHHPAPDVGALVQAGDPRADGGAR